MQLSMLNHFVLAAATRMGLRPPLISADFLHSRLIVRGGTLRSQPDYDDAWVYALGQHSKVVFDVGANVGYDALMNSTLPSVERILLIDPNAEALSIAAENLIRNNLSATTSFLRAFVAETDGNTATLWTVGAGSAGSMYRSHAKTASVRGKSITRPTITIDSLCKIYGVVPDFVKVDVEGAESGVLMGGKGCAKHRATRWLVEMHSNPELPMLENTRRVIEWSDSVGHSVWYLKEHRLLREAGDLARRGRCHILLQPDDWEYPDWLRGIEQGSPIRP